MRNYIFPRKFSCLETALILWRLEWFASSLERHFIYLHLLDRFTEFRVEPLYYLSSSTDLICYSPSITWVEGALQGLNWFCDLETCKVCNFSVQNNETIIVLSKACSPIYRRKHLICTKFLYTVGETILWWFLQLLYISYKDLKFQQKKYSHYVEGSYLEKKNIIF